MRRKSVKNSLGAALCLVTFVGCTPSPDIQDGGLNDRVKACSAGFSEGTRMGLDASLHKLSLSGELTSDVKEETRSLIFDEIPNDDRLKAYEDYISCIQKKWNDNKN